MKLKPLALAVALLAVVAGLVYWRNHISTTEAAADARVGRPLIALDTLARLRGVRLVSGDQSVVLTADRDGQHWNVPDYYALPADFGKLVALVESLRTAKVTRFVTAQPERLARLGFAGDLLELRDADAHPLLTVHLGKNNESGGRFIRFGDEPQAYLADLQAWLDPVAKNWARSQLLDVKPESVVAIEIRFPDGTALAAKRPAPASAWTAEALPEGKELKSEAVDSLVAQLTALRFTETAEPAAPDALAAREHARTALLTFQNGNRYTIALGRRPAPPAPPPNADATKATPQEPATGPAGSAAESPKTETTPPPPGPVFAFITAEPSDDPINALMQKRAFEVGEWALTSLPADRTALLEDKPAAPTPPPATTPPAPKP